MTEFRSLYLLSGTVALGYGSIFTLLPEIRDRYGFAETELGIIVFVGFIGSFVAQVNLAWLADRGHARAMVRGGLTLATLSMLLLALAEHLWQFIALRSLLGVSTGVIGPALRRVIVTRDPDNVGENLGSLSAWDIGGFVLGPLIAGVLGAIDLWVPFVALGALYLVMLQRVVRLDLSTPAGAGTSPLSSLRLVRLRPLRASLVAAVPFYLTLGVYEALWALLLSDLGAEQWFIGLSLSVFTLPMIFFARYGGRTAQQRGPLRVVAVGLTIASVCMIAYGQIGNPVSVDGDQPAQVAAIALLLSISLFHAIADAFTLPGNAVAAAVHAPSDEIAAAQGLFSATGLVVSAVSALGGAALYDRHGAGWAFGLSGAAMLAILACGLFIGRELLRTSPTTS